MTDINFEWLERNVKRLGMDMMTFEMLCEVYQYLKAKERLNARCADIEQKMNLKKEEAK